jgi:hypothetical protein
VKNIYFVGMRDAMVPTGSKIGGAALKAAAGGLPLRAEALGNVAEVVDYAEKGVEIATTGEKVASRFVGEGSHLAEATVNGLEKAAMPLAVAATVVGVVAGGMDKDAKRGADHSMGALGGFVGGLTVGLAAGAAGGSVAGPVGTVVGGLAGGIVGGIVGEKEAKVIMHGNNPVWDIEEKQRKILTDGHVLPEIVKHNGREMDIEQAMHDPEFRQAFRHGIAKAGEKGDLDPKPLLAKIDEFEGLEGARNELWAKHQGPQAVGPHIGRGGGRAAVVAEGPHNAVEDASAAVAATEKNIVENAHKAAEPQKVPPAWGRGGGRMSAPKA